MKIDLRVPQIQSPPLPSIPTAKATASLPAQDSISSYKEHAASSTLAPHKRPPLELLIDLFLCLKHLIISSIQKAGTSILSFFSCLKDEPPAPKPTVPTTAAPAGLRPNSSAAVLPPPPIIPAGPARGTSAFPLNRAGDPLAIHAPTKEAEDAAYAALRLTEADKEDIRVLLTESVKIIPCIQEALAIERRILPVHPLRFLECIFNNAPILKNMKDLKEGSGFDFMRLKWREFLGGLSKKLDEIHRANNLLPHVNAFARSLGREAAEIRKRCEASQWKELVDYLLSTTPAPTALAQDLSPAVDVTATPLPSPDRRAPAERPVPPSAPCVAGGSTAALVPPPPAVRTSTTPPVVTASGDPMALPMTRIQKETLKDLLRTIATHNVVALGFLYAPLQHKWSSLRAVNPLRTLIEAFTEPENFAYINTILLDSWKKNHFLKDFGYTLKEGYKSPQEEILPYLEKFNQQMKIRAHEYIEGTMIAGSTENWANVIKYLNNTFQQCAAADSPSPVSTSSGT